MRHSWCFAVLIYTFVVVEAVDVTTKYGIVRGQTLELHTGARVNTWLGVPFAKPPVGALRFEKPQEPEPWGTIIAEKYGHMCPQTGSTLDLTHPGFSDFNEDCLTINIYSPANYASPGPYPVMVWFHGGGYQSGGNVQYPGHFLSSNGIVVVVANYRLGILGFLTTSDSVVPGNMGLHDQNLVLRFVRENIRGFGGDPDKVTLFGQSAGGSSSGLHIVSPLSQGLFHQAICESGTDLALWANSDPLQNPEEFGRDVAEQVNCSTLSSQEMVDCLRIVDALELVTYSPLPSLGWVAQGFIPVVDGVGGFLPDRPGDLREQGNFSKVRIMSGQTSEDGSPYMLGLVPEAELGGFNRSEFLQYLRRMVDLVTFQEDDQLIENVFRACSFQYSPWPAIDDKEANRQQLIQLVTDAGFGFTGDLQLKSQSEYNDSYMYIMGYRSTNFSELVEEWFGVPHNGELPYVFGYPYLKLNPAVREQTNITDVIDWNDDDRNMTNYVLPLWVNFAKYGNPTPEPVPGPFDNPPQTWDKFNSTHQNYMFIGQRTQQEQEYRQKHYAFFQDYLFWMLSDNQTTREVDDWDMYDEESIYYRLATLTEAVSDFWHRRVSASAANE